MVLRLPRAGSVPKGRARRQLPPFQGRRLEQEGDTSETAGEGSRGEGGGADGSGDLTELPPWEDCGGGVGSPELREVRKRPGGREGASLAGPSPGPARCGRARGAWSPGQPPAPSTRAPPQPPQGSGAPLQDSAFAGGAESGITRRLPSGPRPAPRRVSPWKRGHLGAPRTPPPPPTSQTGTSRARAAARPSPPRRSVPRGRPARPAPPPAGLARPLGSQNSAAPGEARSVHRLPDPRRLLLGFLKEVVAVAMVG
nr:basic salivary proline-rich protein 3-like [Vulpes vulpes]